jgi:hypothetical protein
MRGEANGLSCFFAGLHLDSYRTFVICLAPVTVMYELTSKRITTRIVTACVVAASTMMLIGCGSDTGKPVTSGRSVAGAKDPRGSQHNLVVQRSTEPGVLTSSRREAAFANFGTRANPHEHAVIVGELHMYYGALAGAHFARACSLLSARARGRLTHTANQATAARLCGRRLAAVFANTLGIHNEHAQFTLVHTKDVRVKCNDGYVLFSTVAQPKGEQVLGFVRESGRWRVATTIGDSVIYETPSAAMAEDGS